MSAAVFTTQAAEPALPGDKPMKLNKPLEIKAVALLPDGSMLLGGTAGLCLWKDGVANPVKGLSGGNLPAGEIKDVAVDLLGRWWVATKEGVAFRNSDGQWQASLEGDVHRLQSGPAGSVYVTLGKGEGVKKTTDGKTWELVVAMMPETMRPAAESAKRAE